MKIGTTQGQGRYHIQAEINMIPLIDVALVLLIIFMVISPILVDSQLKINLPKVTNAGLSDETAIKVEVDAKGRVSIEGKIIPRDRLRTAFSGYLPRGHSVAILIQADKDTPFQDVVSVMDIAKQFKVEKLGVAVVPEFNR
ncbi:hypothetical protein BVX98_06470 [bacterium F11]|nr:hypothetical protein BVX98_06470 [bacterium F11]